LTANNYERNHRAFDVDITGTRKLHDLVKNLSPDSFALSDLPSSSGLAFDALRRRPRQEARARYAPRHNSDRPDEPWPFAVITSDGP